MLSRRSRVVTVVTVALFAGTAITASPVGAITFGTPAGDLYPNVGSLVLTIPDLLGPGLDGSVQLCTGTLIAEDVVLTAAHCLSGFPDDWTTTVTFETVIDENQDGLVDDGVELLTGEAHYHPLFASGGANNTYDVGVIVLDQPVDIEPADYLTDLGALDSKAAKRATYTAVGYGTARDSKSGGSNSLGLGYRREYATQSVNSVTKSWITFSMNPSTGSAGTCYGDSGGPHFDASDAVVAVTVTGDRYCRSTDKTYRLDTADAQDFLDDYVD